MSFVMILLSWPTLLVCGVSQKSKDSCEANVTRGRKPSKRLEFIIDLSLKCCGRGKRFAVLVFNMLSLNRNCS